jgi:hypothetical protein
MRTHGTAVTFTAVMIFAAGAVHHVEHVPSGTPQDLIREAASCTGSTTISAGSTPHVTKGSRVSCRPRGWREQQG